MYMEKAYRRLRQLLSGWKYNRHLLALACAIWFAWRVGTNPKRITYPCQRIALMQLVLYSGSIAAPIIGICYQCAGDIRKRNYAKVAGVAALIVLLTCAVVLYRGYEDNQLRIAGSATIPESSSADTQPAASIDRAVVSFNYSPDVGYGSTPPFDSADNPAYGLVWETVDELGLGNTSSPLQKLITPGDTVLIKPNLVNYAPGTFTRPEVVRPLVDMAIAAGATEIYIGDGTGKKVSVTNYIVISAKYSDMVSVLNARHPEITIQLVDLNVLSDGWHWIRLGSNSSFAGSGYTDYDLNSGIETLYGHTHYSTPDPQGINPGGHPLGWYAVNDRVLDADVVINVPKMKTHSMMIDSLAIKNLVGVTLRSTYDEEASDCMPRIAHRITGSTGNDTYFNNDIFWRAILDVNKIVLYADKQGNLQGTQQRKYLNVIDGIQAMEKSESSTGLPYDRHVVLASVDPVAVDAVASRVMGYNFNHVPAISNAASDILHPIGTNNPGKIVILGGEIDSRLNHVFVFNDNWRNYAGSLAVTDFEPPTITVSREGNTVIANISGGSTAYVIYQIDGTDSILEMNRDLDTYSAILPGTVSQCLIRAQDEHFNTASTTPPSGDATLSNLSISSGALVPAFATGITSYTDGVANNVSSVTVTPTAHDSHAIIRVNGTVVASGAASASIALSVGANTITILVTAQDTITTSTYTVTVTRAPSGYPAWDINQDGKADYKDLAMLGAHYGQTTSPPYPAWDINQDEVINYKDLAMLGAHYGETGI